MAGRFVGFGELVVGQRYRVTNRRDGTITGVIKRIVYFTQESKNGYRDTDYGTSLNGIIFMETDYLELISIMATPDTTYELLPAAGGRHRKSRRSHRKSRRSQRKSRRTRRNVTG